MSSSTSVAKPKPPPMAFGSTGRQHKSMNLDVDSIYKSAEEQGNFGLSRPVRPGEQIDFFMSHSWHDGT